MLRAGDIQRTQSEHYVSCALWIRIGQSAWWRCTRFGKVHDYVFVVCDCSCFKIVPAFFQWGRVQNPNSFGWEKDLSKEQLPNSVQEFDIFVLRDLPWHIWLCQVSRGEASLLWDIQAVAAQGACPAHRTQHEHSMDSWWFLSRLTFSLL